MCAHRRQTARKKPSSTVDRAGRSHIWPVLAELGPRNGGQVGGHLIDAMRALQSRRGCKLASPVKKGVTAARMEQFIGCDAHKTYSVFVAVNERGEASQAIRVAHDRKVYRQFLEGLPPRSQIALEASGHYYWIVDEMEASGHSPRLAHPL